MDMARGGGWLACMIRGIEVDIAMKVTRGPNVTRGTGVTREADVTRGPNLTREAV